MRRLGRVVLALVGLVVVAAGVGAAWLQTEAGRRAARDQLVALLAKQLRGGMTIGRIEGNPLRHAVAYDVTVYDGEGAPVLRARRVELWWRPWRLLRREIAIARAMGDGVEVVARPLADGRWSLFDLGQPSPPSPHPWRVLVEHATARGAARYVEPAGDGGRRADPRDPTWRRAEANVVVEGAFLYAQRRYTVRLVQGVAEAVTPLAAQVEASGVASWKQGARVPRLDDAQVTLRIAGTEAESLLPSLRLASPVVALKVKASGVPSALSVEARLAAGPAEVAVLAALHAKDEGVLDFEWHASLEAKGLAPTLVRAAPRFLDGEIAFAARGEGSGAAATVELVRLRARVAGATVSGSGAVNLPDLRRPSAPEVRLDSRWTIEVSDLRRLPWAKLAAPPGRERERRGAPLGGRVRVEARVERPVGRWRIHARLDGKRLAAPALTAAVATGQLEIEGARGWASLEATGVRAFGRGVDRARLDVVGDRRGIALGGEARGPGVSAAIEGHGVMVPGTDKAANKTVPGTARLDGRIERLRLAGWGGVDGQGRPVSWSLLEAAPVSASAERVMLGRLALAHGEQRIELDGQWEKTGRIEGHARARGVRIDDLLSGARRRLPETRLDGDVRVTGTAAAPLAEGEVSLRMARGRGTPAQLVASGRYAAHRLKAQAVLGGLDGGELRARAEVPLPLVGAKEKWSGSLNARGVRIGMLEELARAISASATPEMRANPLGAALRGGLLGGEAELRGSPASPSLSVRGAVEWQDPPLRGSTARLGLQAGPSGVAVSVGLDVPGGNASLRASSPSGLASLISLASSAGRERAWSEVPVHGVLTVDAATIERWPLVGELWAPPRSGELHAAARLDGTLARPSLVADVEASGVSLRGPDRWGLRGRVRLAEKRISTQLDIALQGAPLVRAHGTAEVDLAAALAAGLLPDGALRLDAEVPAWPLDRLSSVAPGWPAWRGVLAARGHVGGTLRRPVVALEASAPGMEVGGVRFAKAEASVDYAGSAWASRVEGQQARGGSLHADVARAADGTLHGRAALAALDVAILGQLLPWLRDAAGQLDARLSLAGTTNDPLVTGDLSLDRGALVVRDVGQRLREVSARVRLDPGRVTVEHLDARAGNGTVHASGVVAHAGWVPTDVSADLTASDFTLVLPGGTSSRLDGAIHVAARPPSSGAGLDGTVTVRSGVLDLPGLQSGKRDLQSLAPLDDVVYVDAAGRRAERAASRNRGGLGFPVAAELVIPGTFAVRGKEVRADVRGSLRVRFGAGPPAIEGTLEAPGGWLDVLEQRFTIDHIRISFTGETPIDPTLDVRLTRTVADTTLAVEVTGRLRHPQLHLSSDPPRYASSEIVGLLLTGNPGATGVAESSLDQKVVGALSSVIIGQIKSEVLPGLPIDVFKVELGQQGQAGTVTSRVEVGKYITPDVYVSYVHQTGQPNALNIVNANQVTVEWRFARRFQLDASYGDAAVGFADLVFRWRF